jgi:hypothetical protein
MRNADTCLPAVLSRRSFSEVGSLLGEGGTPETGLVVLRPEWSSWRYEWSFSGLIWHRVLNEVRGSKFKGSRFQKKQISPSIIFTLTLTVRLSSRPKPSPVKRERKILIFRSVAKKKKQPGNPIKSNINYYLTT